MQPPERNLNRTAASNKLRYLDDCLAATLGSKVQYSKREQGLWALPFVLFLFGLTEEGLVLPGFLWKR